MTTINNKATKSVFNSYRAVVAILTFVAYVAVHANRKSFSNVKVLVAEEWTSSRHNTTLLQLRQNGGHQLFDGTNNKKGAKTFFGVLNTSFMVCYALSQYLGGYLGDRVNLRFLLCGAMVGTSVMMFLCFCVSEWLAIYSIPWYMAFWIVNALLQGATWPSVLAIMGNWFGQSHSGLIFGIWSSSCSVGNVVGALIIAQFLNFGYEFGILVPAVLQVAVAVVCFFGLVVSPEEVGLKLADFEKTKPPADAGNVGEANEETDAKPQTPALNQQQLARISKPISWLEAVFLPGVIAAALCYTCLKLVCYAFFFWLPFYLNRRFHWSQAEADKLSVWFDVGGVIGAIFIGMLSDRLNRSGVMFACLFLSLPTFVIFIFLPDDKVINSLILFLIGFFVFGVTNIVSSAVAADCGRNPKLQSNKTAMATVSGIIDGTGSAGAAMGQIAIPSIEQAFGWSSVFWMLIGCVTLANIIVGRMAYGDLMRWRRFRGIINDGCCYKRRHLTTEKRANINAENQSQQQQTLQQTTNC